MAEMTAEEAFNVLNNKSCRIVFKAKNGVSYEFREGLSEDFAAMIEQQAQEIERLKADVRNMATMSDAHVKMIYEYKWHRDAELAAANTEIDTLRREIAELRRGEGRAE